MHRIQISENHHHRHVHLTTKITAEPFLIRNNSGLPVCFERDIDKARTFSEFINK